MTRVTAILDVAEKRLRSLYETLDKADLLAQGAAPEQVFAAVTEEMSRLGIPGLSDLRDRVMICGSIGLNTDMKSICAAAGLREGSNSGPGHFVVEKAFVG